MGRWPPLLLPRSTAALMVLLSCRAGTAATAPAAARPPPPPEAPQLAGPERTAPRLPSILFAAPQPLGQGWVDLSILRALHSGTFGGSKVKSTGLTQTLGQL
jgi:hypothetical protein